MGVYGVPVPCWRWGWGDPECQGHSFRHGGGCWGKCDPARPWRHIPPRRALVVVIRHVQGVPFTRVVRCWCVIPACPGRPLPRGCRRWWWRSRRVRGVPSPAARWRWGGSGTAPPFPFRHGGGGGVLIRARPILPRLRPRVVIPSRPGRPLLPRRALGDGREGACPSMVV